MKKKLIIFILAGIMALTATGCQDEKQPEETQQPEMKVDAQEEPDEENALPEDEDTAAGTDETGEQEETAAEAAGESAEEDTFSFSEFKRLEFWFSSGAGGWATRMTVNEDGGFSGEYFDGELGVTGEGYPNGTMYQSNFNGQFTQPVKVNDYTYSMQIGEMNYEQEPGSEEIGEDGVLYCYSTVYGLDGAENILIYLPGAPLAELPEEFRSWVGYYDLESTTDTELPFYALYNETKQCGFSSYDVVDSVKQTIASTEQQAAVLEASIENDPLTQAEYNEKTEELYGQWDFALNALWKVLKQTLDEETMRALTAEEREWIAEKEQAVDEAGAEYEGGTMQPMIMNLKAAELTKERVYELMELLE